MIEQRADIVYVTGEEIVNAEYPMPTLNKAITKIRAYKPCAPGDQDV